MECLHCGQKFDKAAFDSHLASHTKRQKELGRPSNRTYGARFVSAKKKHDTQGYGKASKENSKQTEKPTSSAFPTPHGVPQVPKTSASPSSSQSGTASVVLDARSIPRTANWDTRTPKAVRGLQRVLNNYPVFLNGPDGPQLDNPLARASDVSCLHCNAIFSNRDDLSDHYLSKYCPGVSAIVHLMIYDSSELGKYRLEKRLIPFDHRTTELQFQCKKCETCFETEGEADEHEATHPNENVACMHCFKEFSTSYELEQHYDFHDDMEFRHKRDRLRAGESLDDGEENHFLHQPGIVQRPLPGSDEDRIPWQDGDLIAISFISSEDLERAHAPRGVLREPSKYYYFVPQHLDPDHEPGSVSYHEGELCVREGEAGTCYPQNSNSGDCYGNVAAVTDAEEPSRSVRTPVEKTSRLRQILRWAGLNKTREKTKKPKTDNNSGLGRSGTWTELSPTIRQQTGLEKVLRGLLLSTTGAERKDNDPKDQEACKTANWLNKTAPSEHSAKPHGIKLHGHGIPGGVFIKDRSGRSMLVTGVVVGNIFGCIVDFAKIKDARSEAVNNCYEADASSKRGDDEGTAKAWSMALAIFQENPELDPGSDFELVVRWQLANCLDKMHKSLDAELQFLAALELSQRKYGREYPFSYGCINCLAVLYQNLGRLGEAAAMYKRSIAGRAKILGNLHWDTAMSLQELGSLYLALGDFTAALPLLERSLRGFEHAEGPHHNFTIFVMSNLSNVYDGLSMSGELMQLLTRLIPRAADALGPEHIVTGAAVRRYILRYGTANLPQYVAQLVCGYRQSYLQTGSEVARWVLVVC